MADKKEPKYKIKVPKLNATKKSYDFSLSLPGMISLVGVSVLALTFFFVMGILIGRGYRPEADIPQLQPIMPSQEHGTVAEKAEPPKVLTPEELEYPERLKATAEQVMDQQPVDPAKKPEVKKPETAKPEKAKAEAAKPVQPKAEEPAKVVELETTPAKPGEAQFDYIYQVASFKQADMAEALSAKLNASGLKSAVQAGTAKGTTWHRVQVFYRGTPASTNDMKAVLTKHGMGKPLLKKKTPVQ